MWTSRWRPSPDEIFLRAFGVLTLAGIIVWTDKPWLLLFFVVLIPLQIYRARKEEHVLAEKFGASYQDYKRQTWF